MVLDLEEMPTLLELVTKRKEEGESCWDEIIADTEWLQGLLDLSWY